MSGEIKSKDNLEIKQPEEKGYQEICSKNGMTLEKAVDFWKSLFSKKEVRRSSEIKEATESEWGGQYTDYKDRIGRTPADHTERGSYEGERGESRFIPSETTPEGKAAKEALQEYELDGIEYKNGEPDFSKCSECTVEIDDMSEDRASNFFQADIQCAEKWSQDKKEGREDWNPREVKNYRNENNLSWHERCDTRTMDLVPREIHSFFTHSGGCAECKVRNSKGDGFDE